MEGLSGKGKAIFSWEATSEGFLGSVMAAFPLDGTSDGVLSTREYNCQAALSAITNVANAFRIVGVFLQYLKMTFFKRPSIAALKMPVSLRLISFAVMESPKGQLGGWFKALWFDKSLLILDENFNNNHFPYLATQYVNLFYRLLLQMSYGGAKM